MERLDRGNIVINILKKQDCCGCGACEQVCPKACIGLETDNEGFWYPKVETRICIECGLCRQVCPVLEAEKVSANYPREIYAAFAKSNQTRAESSSGGIFSLLAEWILAQGGVVFGAAFAEDFSVHHIKIESKQELSKLRGSKYVQSRIDNTYQEAKAALAQGKLVLFSGVGCQTAGLKAFLRKEYENLFTVDVLCHGVPSPKVWNTYLNHQRKVFKGEIDKISFRNKDTGWHTYSSEQFFLNGKIYSKHHSEDAFMRLFLSEICLRPSCHSCAFREGHSGADVTLGDAWGIEKWQPEMDDDKGTSVVFVNSAKGQIVWDAIRSQVIAKPADMQTVVKHNQVYFKSVRPHPNRKRFFNALREGMPMEQLVSLTEKPLWRKALSGGKRCIKKILGK